MPLILALGLASIWVVLEGIRSRWQGVHLYWVVVNGIYLFGLILVRYGMPANDMTLGLLYAMFLGIQVLDLLLSNSLRLLERI